MLGCPRRPPLSFPNPSHLSYPDCHGNVRYVHPAAVVGNVHDPLPIVVPPPQQTLDAAFAGYQRPATCETEDEPGGRTEKGGGGEGGR